MNLRQIRVHLISRWALNPYQKLLVTHLQDRGLIVAEEAPSLRRLTFRGRPHILHLQNVRPSLTSAGAMESLVRVLHFGARLMLARGIGTRIVWTAHDLESPSSRHKIVDRLMTAILARLAHRTIVHSDAARTRLAAAARVSERHVHVIPHGHYIGHYPDTISRTDARTTLGIGDDEVVFLLFGWVKRYKRVTELIRAFRSLSCKGARLVIAGKASERAYENEIRTEAAGDPRILLHLHSIADAEVQLYMNASDVVVFPYAPVLTSGAIVLAHSFGKACVVSSNSGVEDTADRDGAFFYDPGVEGDLTGALQTAIDHRDRLAQIGAYNRVNAERRNWQDVAESTLQLYTAIL